ncbi:MAG TPA: hypothetical protein VG963_23845 [Polyangiaceae bacterium]|nr:hypothetical protein [Polyangiaceae bacterium]
MSDALGLRFSWLMTAEEHADSWARYQAAIRADRELSDRLAREWAAEEQAELQAA